MGIYQFEFLVIGSALISGGIAAVVPEWRKHCALAFLAPLTFAEVGLMSFAGACLIGAQIARPMTARNEAELVLLAFVMPGVIATTLLVLYLKRLLAEDKLDGDGASASGISHAAQ